MVLSSIIKILEIYPQKRSFFKVTDKKLILRYFSENLVRNLFQYLDFVFFFCITTSGKLIHIGKNTIGPKFRASYRPIILSYSISLHSQTHSISTFHQLIIFITYNLGLKIFKTMEEALKFFKRILGNLGNCCNISNFHSIRGSCSFIPESYWSFCKNIRS